MKKRALIVLIDNNEILLLFRYNKGKEYYCLPGGSVEKDETVNEAALREMKQETGLTITIERELWVKNNEVSGAEEHIVLAIRYSGTLGITGHDLRRQEENNYYRPEWTSIYELKYCDLVPATVKDLILKEFGQKWRWDKLVRDKLPEFIASRGRTAKWHIADDAEYWHELKKKLAEEVAEFIKAEGPGELGDVEEVIDAIYAYKKFDRAEVMKLRDKKATEKGRYEKRIFLEESTGE